MIFALIPAGGKSERMGRPKLLLRIGETTVLERVIAAFQSGGVPRILVLAARHLPELKTLAERAGATGILLPEATADMRGTIEFGLHWAETHWQPGEADAWFLAPADHPGIDAHVIRTLEKAAEDANDRSIYVPTFKNQRGHPALIRWRHVESIRRHPVGLGLNHYFRAHADETLEVAVAASSILSDMDTPEDYERTGGERKHFPV